VPLFVEGKSDARVISILIEHIKYLGWLQQQHQVSSVLVGQILKIHIPITKLCSVELEIYNRPLDGLHTTLCSAIELKIYCLLVYCWCIMLCMAGNS